MDIASLVISVVSDGLDDANRRLRELSDRAERAQGRVDKFNKNMEGLRNAALGVGAVLTGVLYTSAKAAMDFESAMADVKKVVDFDTPDGLQKMNDDLLEMSTRIPIAATGLAEIAAAAGQAGIAANEIPRFTEAAAKMGTAFDITAEQAGTAMAEMRVAFGFTQDEVETLADKINYLGNTTPNAAAGLTEVVQRIGAIAKISGVSADQLAAMAGSITSLAPEVVATGLKNLMTRLTAGASATKGMRAAWLDLGFTAEDVAKGMQEDSEAMINAVLSSLRKLPKEEQTAYLNTLFGQEALPVVAQLMTNTELLAENLNAMGDASKYAGSMQAEFEARSATTANQLELLKNNVNVAQVALGSALLPAINDIAKAVIPVVQSFAQWADKNPELVQQIVIVVGAITGAILAISGIGLAVSGAISAFSGLIAIGTALTGAIAAISLPVIAVVAVIAALVAAGVALYNNWDTVKGKAAELGNYLSTEFASVKESVSGVVDGVKDSFNSIVQTVSPALQAVADVFKGTFGSFAQIAQGQLQLVISVVKATFMGIVTTIGAVLQIAFTVFKAGFDLMKNAVMTVMKIIVAIIDGDFKRIPKIMGDGISKGVSIVGNALGKIVDVIKNYGKKMFEVGKDFMQGFINGIKSIAGGVVSAASTMASNAVAAVRRAQDSHSPSKKTLKLGKDFGKGYANGIKASKKPVISEAQKMAEQAVKAVKDTIATLQRDIALFGNDDPVAAMLWDRANTDKYKGVDNGLFNQAVDLTKQKEALELADKFKEALKGIQDAIKGSVSTELEKWSTALYDADNELSKLEGGKKLELLTKAADLDYSNLSKEMAKSNLEIDRQLELMGARTDLDKELLKIGYDLTDTMAKYSYYLETGQEARYKELEAIALANAEKQKGLAILKEQQRTSDAMNNMLGGLNEKSPLEKLQDEQDERLRIIQESMLAEGEMKQSHIDAMLAIDERYERDLQKLKLAQYGDGLSLFTQFMGSMLGENKRAKRIMFALEKGFALATVLIENKKALAKAWSSAPFPYNMALVAKTAMQTGALSAAVQAISPKGFKSGGYTGSIGANNVAGVVHGNEYVFDAQSTKAIGVENLERIRRGKGTGEVNITVNNHSSAKVETETDSQGNIIMTIRDEVKRSWSNLQNPNSHESKMLGRNVQAPRRRT